MREGKAGLGRGKGGGEMEDAGDGGEHASATEGKMGGARRWPRSLANPRPDGLLPTQMSRVVLVVPTPVPDSTQTPTRPGPT